MTVESDRQVRAFDEQSYPANANHLSCTRRVSTSSLIVFAASFAASVTVALTIASVSVPGFDSAWLSVLVLGSVVGMARGRQSGPGQSSLNQYTSNMPQGTGLSSTLIDTDIITHELESAIYAIQRLVSVGEFSDPTDDQTKLLNGVRSELDHLRMLVQDLQSISDLNRSVFEIQPRVIELDSLLPPAIHSVQTVSGDHNVELVIEGQTSVYADPDRIGQVMRNLLLNAVKYSPPNTTIQVRATVSGDRTLIEVIDEGMGIAPDDRDRIFKPYDRGGDRRKLSADGAGLGLYIAQCITRLHGSPIRVSTPPGGGSVFSFSLEPV